MTTPNEELRARRAAIATPTPQAGEESQSHCEACPAPGACDGKCLGGAPSTPQAAGVSEEMVSAVRFAPTSAYWSEKLVEFFGPEARSGIDVLDARIRELTAAGAAPEGWVEISARIAEDILRGPLANIPAEEHPPKEMHAQHLAWMCMKLAAKDVGSATKCCRWLGYVQGAMVEGGWSTLAEEKERNRQFAAAQQPGAQHGQEGR